jgi:hypothetical protein
MLKVFLIALLLTLPLTGNAQTCEQLFGDSSANTLPGSLQNISSASDWKILKAAQFDILGERSLSQKARDHALSFLEIFRVNQNYREQIEIEIRRRDFKAALQEMGVTTHTDPLYWLRNNKHYFSTLFSVAVNSSLNYLSYHYLGTAGFVAHVPKTRFFKPDQIPDAVIEELLTSDNVQPRTRNYIKARVGHGADLVINNVRKYFHIGLLASVVIMHGDILMDPFGYVNNQLSRTSDAISNYARNSNLELIQKLELKKELFLKKGALEKVAAAEALIREIKENNNQLIQKNSGAILIWPQKSKISDETSEVQANTLFHDDASNK